MLNFGQIFNEQYKNGKEATLGDLLEILAKASDPILDTEFCKILVDYFYEENLYDIKNFCFYPFAIYFFSTICYMSYFMVDNGFKFATLGW